MAEKDIKLEFTVEEADSNLVFEGTSDAKKKKGTSQKASASKKDENTSEFTVPEKYTPHKKYEKKEENEAKAPEEEKTPHLPHVQTTYIPRFTEVSETYRVSSSKQPRKADTKKQTPEVIVVSDSDDSAVDPTAEIDGNSQLDGATVVAVGAPAPENYDISSTVFKFDVDKAEDAPTVAEYIEEESSEEENLEEQLPELEPISEEPEEYVMPDPAEESRELALTDLGSAGTKLVASRFETAENVGDDADGTPKKKSEYVTHAKRDSFKDRFLDTIMSVKVRLFASLAILAILLLVENLWLFGVDIPGAMGLSAVPGSMALIDAQLVICLLILAMPEVINAFRRLFVGRAVPELFVPAAALAVVGYCITVIFKDPESYPLFGLLFALLSVGAIASTLFRELADFSNFKVISSVGEKMIVDRKLTRSLAEENIAVDGKVEGYKSKTARVFRAAFVADFFKRSKKCAENSHNVVIMLAAAFGVALVAGAVAFFILEGFLYAMMTFTSVFLLGMPALSIISHKIPFYHSVKQAESEDSAIIGESSLYDYSGVDVVTFNDTEVFGEEEITLQRIMLYGRSENLEKAMHQMSAIFSVVGGPLDIMFSDSLDHQAPRAARVRIEEDGIIGIVDGNEVRAGSLEYMVKNGVKIPYDPTKDSTSFLSTKIMYAAENGTVYAKFYIRYTFSEEFTMLLPALEDEGIIPLVYTRDPNINNELLRTLTAGADKIRVLKKQTLTAKEEKVYTRVSAGIVTSKSKDSAINMILLSKKYVRFQNRMSILELTAMASGVALAVILALCGMRVVPSLLLSLWQVACAAALVFMSRRTLVLPDTKQEQE